MQQIQCPSPLRYLIQKGEPVRPKSVHKERMVQNIDVLDFELTKEDIDVIAGLDKRGKFILLTSSNY